MRKAKRAKPPWIYFVAVESHAVVKIGVATDVKKRLDQLQTASPFELTLLGVIAAPDAYGLETTLHLQFSHLHVRGEWFRLEPELTSFIEAEASAAIQRVRRAPRTPIQRYDAAVAAAQKAADDALAEWERKHCVG